MTPRRWIRPPDGAGCRPPPWDLGCRGDGVGGRPRSEGALSPLQVSASQRQTQPERISHHNRRERIWTKLGLRAVRRLRLHTETKAEHGPHLSNAKSSIWARATAPSEKQTQV